MVQSPESTLLPAAQRKRRREDHFPDSPNDLKPWAFLPDPHHPLHLLTTKFTTTTTTPPTQKLKQPTTNTTPPRRTPFSPKLKRLRGSHAAREPEEMVIEARAAPRTAERCHVCLRAQSVMPSFGTIAVCAVCVEKTCYVCTRKCDSCEETVCSRCAEEKGVHSFCTKCMRAWKDGGM